MSLRGGHILDSIRADPWPQLGSFDDPFGSVTLVVKTSLRLFVPTVYTYIYAYTYIYIYIYDDELQGMNIGNY